MLAGALALVFGHAVWFWCDKRWSHPRLLQGRATFAAAVEEPWLEPQRMEQLRRDLDRLCTLPARLQIQLFSEFVPNLGPSHRPRLMAAARESGLIARAERLCRSWFWRRRLRGVRLLTLLGGGEQVVPALLADRHVEVRAQAAEWTADHPTPELINCLLGLLADPAGLCRFSVQDSLLRMGRPVVEPLVRYLSEHSRPGIEAGLKVAVGLADPRFLAPALALCRDPSPKVRALAAGLLGALGGSDAVRELSELLADPSSEVRAASAQALGMLGHWPAAPKLAVLLRDPAWRVRREAGLALRALRAPGILLLRRSLSDKDHFAADMARQVLDLPDTPNL